MMRRIFFFISILALIVACTDDESFSTDSKNRLSFSVDTVRFDTLFSRIPSSTRTFWVYNRSNDGISLSSIYLAHRNQTGYRVNVDGLYLDNANGSQVNNIKIRKGDSLLVFVELTSADALQKEPKAVNDDLIFKLESGIEQRIALSAWTWDATKLNNLVIQCDTTIESTTPIIIYGGLTINSAATLTIRNTTLYFHDKAGIDVYGRLVTENTIMRGDRLDCMFDYLPYDRVSGQWAGLHFHQSSTDNELHNTEIRNPKDGILVDSAALDSTRYRLQAIHIVVHNCEGTGLESTNANIKLNYCQFSNTYGDCINIIGGMVDINNCTLAQFYPFSALRGTALRFSNYLGDKDIPLLRLLCENSIITGYDEDLIHGSVRDTIAAFEYRFANSLLRTPKVEDDTVHFSSIIWETPKDSIQGKEHFLAIDENNLYYDFHLDSLSTAKGLGCY